MTNSNFYFRPFFCHGVSLQENRSAFIAVLVAMDIDSGANTKGLRMCVLSGQMYYVFRYKHQQKSVQDSPHLFSNM
jgi:hypothetical protein